MMRESMDPSPQDADNQQKQKSNETEKEAMLNPVIHCQNMDIMKDLKATIGDEMVIVLKL